MSVMLSENDKEIIRLIDSQVKQLIDKNAPEHVIINTLIDFIPETKCIINSTCMKELEVYYQKYQNFNYFAQLITQEMV
ncbi:hypothetical protein [Legionella cardiaca]|uniref:Ankyrin repeat protein n=1 Tax=Legionella cardiaca TaxID=1071983 RepID=A0ABY8ATP5_9GAMM|nr:hypothetical protein [Legionella cardiaca]WED44060.1 hypothetical protein PXX05_04540 [Legionella cardiaca]